MAICPIANKIGCEECTVVKVCVLRSVLGNYGETDNNMEQTEATTLQGQSPDNTTENRPLN